MQKQSPVRELADLVGIVPQYLDQTGTETRATSDETRVAILGAMGIDASTPEAARAALEALRARDAARVLEPVRVVRRDDPDAAQVTLQLPEGAAGDAEWSLELLPERGEPRRMAGRAQPEWNGTVAVHLGELPPEGYHTLRAAVRVGGEKRSGEQSLVVAPEACPSVAEVAGSGRVWGVIANLYTVRSARDWGVGDLTDLGALLEWTAGAGGAFVGVNPLHALRNSGMDVSPYSPVSRLFRNTLYLDVEAVPEAAESDEARRMLESAELRAEREALRAGDRVEYERVMALKRPVLEALHREFAARHGGGGTERGRAYREYVEAQGEALEAFATFEALADARGTGSWREWPEELRDPASPAVAAFRAERAEAVDFHRWLQWELDRQLGEAAARGARAGLPIGLYQDLAIGTSASSADVWANPRLFLPGASIGAPPDEYSAGGQNWGLPPMDPRVLREDGYRYWIALVRACMRHAGALRIDHAIGLFRQFWIPEGMSGAQGAYVTLPAEDLLGILALEACRHGALVVGEDLGTVPEEVPPTMHRRGVLSSRVFYFEREGDAFRPAADYEPMALATANTHDMPSLAGFWAARDVELKREVGLIDSDEAAAKQREARVGERRAILERLAADGALPAAEEPASPADLRGAVHEFLCRTPSALVGFSLDDLVGEVEPVNLPGVPPEKFSSWTRKLATPIEALATDPDVRAALRCGGRGTAGNRE
ncbi:MAG TPA: 4-alpha-glucanotransferase [Longimicrobiaceae bacterium]|jgi:4-alpha-glucanotransferase